MNAAKAIFRHLECPVNQGPPFTLLKHDQKLFWLDVSRGLCALAVCAGHLRSMLLTDFASLGSSNLLQKALYLVTGFGHQAVMVFFVLSGFFVGGAVLRSGSQFRWLKYGIDRLSRLWTVLIPALLLTALLDLALPAPVLAGAFSSTWNSGPGPTAPYSATPATFLGNLFFLQTVFTPVYGTNNPLWSLANEFWYYLLFPLHAYAAGLIGTKQAGSTPWRWIGGVTATVALVALPANIREGYAVWLLGVLACYLSRSLPLSRWSTPLLLAGSAVMTGTLYYAKSAAAQAQLGLPSDMLVGLGFFMLSLGLISRTPSVRRANGINRLLSEIFARLSDVSYSLYLTHFPLVLSIGAHVYGGVKLKPDGTGSLSFTGWLLLLWLCAWCFWWAFERRTVSIRAFALARAASLSARH